MSQHVRQLEVGFGTSLLDRSTRPARPTASGQRLYEQARDLLVHVVAGIAALQQGGVSNLGLITEAPQ